MSNQRNTYPSVLSTKTCRPQSQTSEEWMKKLYGDRSAECAIEFSVMAVNEMYKMCIF